MAILAPLVSSLMLWTEHLIVLGGHNLGRFHQQMLVLAIAGRLLRSLQCVLPYKVLHDGLLQYGKFQLSVPGNQSKGPIAGGQIGRCDDVPVEATFDDFPEVVDLLLVGTGMVQGNDCTVFAVVQPSLGWNKLIFAVSGPQRPVGSKSRNALVILDRLVHAPVEGHVCIRNIAKGNQRFHVVIAAVIVPIVQTHEHRCVADVVWIEVNGQISLGIVAVRIFNTHHDAAVLVGARNSRWLLRWVGEPGSFPFLFGNCACH